MQPYEDIDITFTGLRPGEKMYEELFNKAETLLPTSHPRIESAQSQPVDKAFMEAQIEEIKSIIMQKDVEALHNKFVDLVPGYRCSTLEDQACETETGSAQGVALPG
jgi:FlaA1/EpsC-like NDP-sugar epimerase